MFLVLTAPAKQFKAVNNSISKVIRVMITKPGGFCLVKFGTGSNTERTQKYAMVKVQNDIRPHTYVTGFGEIGLNG